MVEIDRQLQHISPRLVAKHESFGPLADAISATTTVVFEYRKSDGSQSVREVEPLKLRLIEGEWVLLAREREAVKNFLLRRIVSKVRDTEALFTPPSEAVITRAEQDLVAFAASNVAVIEIVPDSEAWWHFGSERDHFVSGIFLSPDRICCLLRRIQNGRFAHPSALPWICPMMSPNPLIQNE